jgi:hypothetical protein
MGAGSYPAGIGPAGHDPVSGLERVLPTMPVAAQFDPDTRQFVINVDGELVPIHPVDQEVAIRLGVGLGTIAAASGVGLNLARLRRTSAAAMQLTVNDEVSFALADLIRNGDIQLLGSPLMPDARGRPFFYVDYRNLRLPTTTPAQQARVRV